MKALAREHIGLFSVLFTYVLLFLPFIGTVHLFDWDEINFAEAAREMIVTGDWLNVQVNYEPFWEKPPLFIWCQALSMKVFGVTEFAARFPNVVFGFVTMLVIYFPVYNRYGKQSAVFAMLFYLGSYTSHLYFKSGIIDPLFNLLIYLSVLYLVKSTENNTQKTFLLSGLFLGLAVVTKGPAAILLVGLSGLFFQIIYKVNFYTWKSLIALIVGFLLIPGLFFGSQVATNGWWFLQEFISYQVELLTSPVASHGQPFYYHLVVLLIGCFPMFIIALPSLLQKQTVYGDATLYRWMKVLFWVVLIVFSLVTTKIVHYSSMCYIPIAIVAGVWLSNIGKVSAFHKVCIGLIGCVWVMVYILAGLLGRIDLVGLVGDSDPFFISQISTNVDWNMVPIILGFVVLIYLMKVLWAPSKQSVSSFLLANILATSLFVITFIPPLEKTIQGTWVDHLQTYQGKNYAHFTLGFKSYAHRFYTHQTIFEELDSMKKVVMQNEGISSLYKLNQEEKKSFDNTLRDAVIKTSTIPITVSVRKDHFHKMERYPSLVKVFEGSGYGVFIRKL